MDADDTPARPSRGDGFSRPSGAGATIFRDATILTLDPEIGELDGGDLLIDGDRIVGVGREIAAPPGALEIDARGYLLMPGFVDGHRHCWQGSLRRLLTEADLPRYMAVTHDGVARHYRPEDMYAGDLVALLGAIDHGFTTVLDLSHNTRSRAHADAVFQAYRDAGIRAVHASAPPNAGDWEEHWPEDLIRLTEVASRTATITVRMAIDMRRVRPIRELLGVARELHLGIHIDGAMGAGTSAELIELGDEWLLGPDVTVVHATSLADSAWDRIGESGTRIVLATTSDEQLGLAGGVPPIQEVMDRGIRPGLSVDVEIALAGDPFTQMRTTMLTQRMLATAKRVAGDREVRLLGSAEVLGWATLGGAHASGLGAEVGSLSAGKRADLLVIDLDDIGVVPGGGDLAGVVVHGIDRSNIRGVIIGGRARKWAGELVGVDLDEVRTLAERSRDHLLASAGFSLDAKGLRGVPALRDPHLVAYLGSHDDDVIR